MGKHQVYQSEKKNQYFTEKYAWELLIVHRKQYTLHLYYQ